MNGIPNEERQRLGALLDHTSQKEVMSQIPQFAESEIHNIAPPRQKRRGSGYFGVQYGAGRLPGGAGGLSGDLSPGPAL